LIAGAGQRIVMHFHPGQGVGQLHAPGVAAGRTCRCYWCFGSWAGSRHRRTVFQNGFEEAFHRRDFGIQRFFPETDLVGREFFRTATESPALQLGDGAFQAGDDFIPMGDGLFLLSDLRFLLGDMPGAFRPFRFLFLLRLQQAQHQIAQRFWLCRNGGGSPWIHGRIVPKNGYLYKQFPSLIAR